jgi:hypothetical protein
MRLRLALIVSMTTLAACDVSIPNGLFACGQLSDCPADYFCWSSDSRCYDTKEPACEPKTCEQVISEFAGLGISIECGSLPDGCDGSIQCGNCPEGTVCGANGKNFTCGCAENTCASYGGGAECGFIPSQCGAEEQIFCGDCFGDYVCLDNRCACPPGATCDPGCPGGEPLYPCSKNECSPPGGLPDGCGGVSHCPACSNGEDCVLSSQLRYECVGDCTCEAAGVECGSATICGSPALCGTCADNDFGAGYRCESGRCVCEDQFEPNDSFDNFALVCGEGAGLQCLQEAWSVDVPATLHSKADVDYYALRVLDASTPIIAQISGGQSKHVLYMTYLCPDGREGMVDCSASTDSMEDLKFCIGAGNAMGIQRRCDDSSSQIGTVLVGVRASEFEGDCDPYQLKVFATYEVPLLISF